MLFGNPLDISVLSWKEENVLQKERSWGYVIILYIGVVYNSLLLYTELQQAESVGSMVHRKP